MTKHFLPKDVKKTPSAVPFNGHPSWEHWNVYLWFSGDYDLYQLSIDLVDDYGIETTVGFFNNFLNGKKTPDGAIYEEHLIRYALSSLKK